MQKYIFPVLFFGLMSQVGFAQQIGCADSCAVGFGCSYSGGPHGQMFPYDQQDPWLHGQYRRVPSYAGYNRFRPYNYRHVASQGQIATNWGATHGMTYSQQFWNRYRTSYLNGDLHAAPISSPAAHTPDSGSVSATTISFPGQTIQLPKEPVLRRVPTEQSGSPGTAANVPPVHVYPEGVRLND